MSQTVLDLGIASSTLAGHGECGDLHVVAPFADGVLIAVVDGIGHGPEAAEMARVTEGVLRSRPHEPVVSLITCCHERLRATRGAVMSLASFNVRQGTMTWAGVGNVESRLLPVDAPSKPKTLLLSAGTLGHQSAPVYPSVVPIRRGDTLLMVTDGIRQDFDLGLYLGQPPQKLADRILAQHARQTDDALVLVGCYSG